MNTTKSSIQNKKPGLGGRLTIKQQRFVDAYIRNGGNGTGAVFDAGYDTVSERSAQVIASQNLKKPVIMLALEEAGADYVDVARGPRGTAEMMKMMDLLWIKIH